MGASFAGALVWAAMRAVLLRQTDGLRVVAAITLPPVALVGKAAAELLVALGWATWPLDMSA